MKKTPIPPIDSLNLRRKAEEKLKHKTTEIASEPSESDSLKLLQELRLQQAELEIQNEALMSAIANAKDATDLYDFAPTGYYTLSREGEILRLNLSGADFLGKDRTQLVKSRFGFFVSDETKHFFNHFLDDVFNRKTRQNCDITLTVNGGTPKYIQMAGIVTENNENCMVTATDITERKRAEEAIFKSKEQYDKLAASIPVGVYVLHSKIDGSFNLDYASPRMAEMLGFSVDGLLNDARLVYESIYPEDRAGFAQLNEDGIRLKQAFNWTGRILSGGKIKWMHLTSSPEILENGDILWHGLIVDITKEKLAEDERNEAHNRLLKIASRVPGVVFQYKLRPDGTDCFPYASEGLNEIYHVSPEEVREDACKAFANIHPADFAGLTASIKVSETDLSPWKHEYRVKFPDGTVNWLLGNAVPQKEADGSVLWHGFITDITEGKLVELALKESESRFKNLFEHHSAIMLLIDPDSGLIIDANKAATHFYGYSKSLLQTMTIDEINILSKEQVKMELEKARNSNHNNFVFLHKLANGEERTVEVYSSPINFQEKQILFSIIQDITERKLAESEIQIKNEELLKVNAEKDKFFSIIAHDLRGPIGGFMGLTALMAEGMANMTLDDLQNIARVMKRSASNLYNLLGNLLEWSLMQRGLTKFEPVSFLLIHKIHENLIQAHESATKKAITINMFIPGNLKVCADENMLACIIRNLLANAVKFTPKGGNISISATLVNNRFAEISISDSGIGMSKKLIENLFTIDVNTNRKGTDGELSSGLGLMICKDFIEKHGGELKVESEVGNGSTFRFTIPTADFE